MNEKTTSLSPKSSQNFSEQGMDHEYMDERINAQILADPEFFLPSLGQGPQFHEDPIWTERKEERKETGKQLIKEIWADHAEFLKNSGYLNPSKPSQFLPQFFADREKNLRLAQIFSIPIVRLRDQSYENRLHDWAVNVISVFGNTVSEPRYREWGTNNILRYNHPREKDHVVSTIAARVFFTDLHHLAKAMPNGRKFVTDLFHKIRDLQDAGERGIDEEEFKKTALTHCYVFSANDCIKEEALERTVALYVKPELKTLNRLADQFCIQTVRKGRNRDRVPEQTTVSYGFNKKFEMIPTRTPKDPPIPKRNLISTPIADKVTDQEEGTAPPVIKAKPTQDKEETMSEEDKTLHTPAKDPKSPGSPREASLSMSDLGGKEGKVRSSLVDEFTEASFEHLLGKSKAFESYFQTKLREALDERERDDIRLKINDDRGKETLLSSSSSASRAKEEGQVLITALSTKEAAAIVLNSLELSAVEMWGNRVIDFEKKYRVKWDRTTIPRDVRDQINIRWSQEIYNIHLPPTLVTSIESGEGFADDQWLEPHIISTEELYKYLKKSSSMEKKRTSFKTGFEEVLEYIKNYRLSFGTGTAHKSVEKFLAQSKRLYQESKQTITHHEEKELCKATCKMVEEAQQSDADMLERIVEKERHSPPPPSKPYNPGTAVDP